MIRRDLGAPLLLSMALLVGAPRAAHAAESYDNCSGFITSLPAVISTPGTWCLNQDLSTAMSTGNAIEIQADDITIDCNNFKLTGSAGFDTQTVGIYSLDHRHETVRHCDVRGFYRGIRIASASNVGGHLVEDNRLVGNTYLGLLIYGDGSVARRNLVLNTGGSTVTTSITGIYTADATEILDNTISGVGIDNGVNGNARGIFAISFSSGRIIGNSVRGLVRSGTGHSYGILAPGSTLDVTAGRFAVRNNNLVGAGAAGGSYTGIACYDATGNFNTYANAKDNLISGFELAIDGCTDVGGNTVIP